MRRIFIYLAIALMVGGCSTVEINKINDSTYSGGLRFYRPDLYLLVTEDTTKDKDGTTKTTQTTKIIPLPNKNEEYVIKPVPRLGTVDASATLTDGWNLSVLGAKVDTKIPETITALTGTLSAVASLAKGMKAEAKPKPLEPGLYRIDFNNNGQVSGITKVF